MTGVDPMATRPDPFPYERRLRDLDRLYAEAQATIAARIETAVRSGDLFEARRARMQLASIVAVLDQLGATVTPIARKLVADAFQQGADRTLREIRALRVSVPEIPGAFTGVSRQAVEQLQASLLDRLDSASQTLGRRVEDIYARETRRASLRAILGQSGSPRAATNDLMLRLQRDRQVAALVRDGGVGFVDSAGKRWQLRSYADMAIRTQTREAVVQGAMTRMVSHGIDLARISTSPGACEKCRPYEGRLVSLTGATTEYQGEPVMSGPLPPFHGRCTHHISAVVTAIEDLKRELALAGRL